MTTIPLTEQEVAEDFVVLNLQNVALSDEQFVELCADNGDFLFELTARKELVIMPLPGAIAIARERAMTRLTPSDAVRMITPASSGTISLSSSLSRRRSTRR